MHADVPMFLHPYTHKAGDFGSYWSEYYSRRFYSRALSKAGVKIRDAIITKLIRITIKTRLMKMTISN